MHGYLCKCYDTLDLPRDLFLDISCKRDDVKAKLRLLVKKVLMRYGYPPDLAKLEADRVLEQSKLFAEELTEK